MKDRVFLDTNVLVYMFDKSEGTRHETAKTLFKRVTDDGNPHISVQNLNEFIVIVSQKIKKPLPLSEVKKRVDFLNGMLTVSSLSWETCNLAIEIKAEYKLSYWDSLVIASALENDCRILYTEDMQNELVVKKRLVVKNPF